MPDTQRQILVQNLKEVIDRADAASLAFEKIVGNIPSSLPQPDGTQRIHNASPELSQARAAMMKAHINLNEFFGRAIGPEDLELGD